ncbi:MAG TPA: pseudouridine synthase [Acidimicrobiales bacterium]|nr:pseudouridine synthase [Acidimicrobiales bacterium]
MATEPPTGERLQKVLAAAGIASRRQCEIYIAQGRVRVDGEVAELGRRVDPTSARIELDGAPVSVAPGQVHYLLNKPPGVVSTASDPRGRPTVVSLVPAEPRVYPVGRLDMDSEGLLLVTNDGELTHRLTHPSYEVPKEYLAEVSGRITPRALQRLRTGVELDDGLTAPATVSSPGPGMLRIVIHEGRNRQVRRMVAAVGGEVTRLVRTRIGPITGSHLAPGEWRPLEADELRALERLVSTPDR